MMTPSTGNGLLGEMPLRVKRWLTPPVFPEDEAKTRRANLLNWALLTLLAFMALLVIGNLLGGNVPALVNVLDLAVFLLCLVLRKWMRRGSVQPAGFGLMVLGIVAITAGVAMLGTIRSPSMATLMLVVMTAGLLFDVGGMIVITLLCSLAVAGLVIAENAGALPRPDYTVTITQWVTYTILFAFVGSLTYSALRSMRLALARAESALAERERAQDALQAATHEWQATFDAVPDAIWVLDADQRILRSNKATQEIFGHAASEVIGRHCWEVVHGTPQPIAECPIRRMRLSLQRETMELQVGARRFNVTVDPLLDPGGQLTGVVHIVSDISERKRVEEALRASEEKYRKLYSEMASGCALHEIVCDANGNPTDYITLDVNAAYESLLGAQRELVVGTKASDILPPEELQRWLGIFGPVALTGASTHYEMYSPLNQKHFEGTAYCPEPGKFAVIFAEVTERVRMEEALREGERRLQREHDLLEAVTAGTEVIVATQDTNLCYTFFNQAYMEEIKRLSGKEIQIGSSIAEIFADMPEQQQDAVASWSSVLKGKSVARRMEFGDPGRYRRAYSIRHTPIRDAEGNIVGAGEVAFDITDQVRAEEALWASEERFRVAQEISLAAFTILECVRNDQEQIVDFVCTYANPVAAQILRRPPELLIGHRLLEALPESRENNALFDRFVRIVMSGQGDEVEVKFHTDGIHGWFRNMAIKLDDGVAVSFSNITARKEAEEALQTRNEELDAFAHTVAHDLKNPLGIVLSAVEALAQGMVDPATADGQHLLELAVRSTYKADSIIESLLALAGAHQMEGELAPLDMASIVSEVRLRLTSLQEQRQAQITMPETWPTVLGYAPWVEEVWVNYLSNAFKYGGHPPRVELGYTILDLGSRIADLPSPQSEIRNRNSAFSIFHSQFAGVRFWVRDHGSGLTAEEQAHLFTPFTRLSQVGTKGHGLGLSIVRRIVEKLGGAVGVESTVGEGSLFWFTLPLAKISD